MVTKLVRDGQAGADTLDYVKATHRAGLTFNNFDDLINLVREDHQLALYVNAAQFLEEESQLLGDEDAALDTKDVYYLLAKGRAGKNTLLYLTALEEAGRTFEDLESLTDAIAEMKGKVHGKITNYSKGDWRQLLDSVDAGKLNKKVKVPKQSSNIKQDSMVPSVSNQPQHCVSIEAPAADGDDHNAESICAQAPTQEGVANKEEPNDKGPSSAIEAGETARVGRSTDCEPGVALTITSEDHDDEPEVAVSSEDHDSFKGESEPDTDTDGQTHQSSPRDFVKTNQIGQSFGPGELANLERLQQLDVIERLSVRRSPSANTKYPKKVANMKTGKQPGSSLRQSSSASSLRPSSSASSLRPPSSASSQPTSRGKLIPNPFGRTREWKGMVPTSMHGQRKLIKVKGSKINPESRWPDLGDSGEDMFVLNGASPEQSQTARSLNDNYRLMEDGISVPNDVLSPLPGIRPHTTSAIPDQKRRRTSEKKCDRPSGSSSSLNRIVDLGGNAKKEVAKSPDLDKASADTEKGRSSDKAATSIQAGLSPEKSIEIETSSQKHERQHRHDQFGAYWESQSTGIEPSVLEENNDTQENSILGTLPPGSITMKAPRYGLSFWSKGKGPTSWGKRRDEQAFRERLMHVMFVEKNEIYREHAGRRLAERMRAQEAKIIHLKWMHEFEKSRVLRLQQTQKSDNRDVVAPKIILAHEQGGLFPLSNAEGAPPVGRPKVSFGTVRKPGKLQGFQLVANTDESVSRASTVPLPISLDRLSIDTRYGATKSMLSEGKNTGNSILKSNLAEQKQNESNLSSTRFEYVSDEIDSSNPSASSERDSASVAHSKVLLAQSNPNRIEHLESAASASYDPSSYFISNSVNVKPARSTALAPTRILPKVPMKMREASHPPAPRARPETAPPESSESAYVEEYTGMSHDSELSSKTDSILDTRRIGTSPDTPQPDGTRLSTFAHTHALLYYGHQSSLLNQKLHFLKSAHPIRDVAPPSNTKIHSQAFPEYSTLPVMIPNAEQKVQDPFFSKGIPPLKAKPLYETVNAPLKPIFRPKSRARNFIVQQMGRSRPDPVDPTSNFKASFMRVVNDSSEKVVVEAAATDSKEKSQLAQDFLRAPQSSRLRADLQSTPQKLDKIKKDYLSGFNKSHRSMEAQSEVLDRIRRHAQSGRTISTASIVLNQEENDVIPKTMSTVNLSERSPGSSYLREPKTHASIWTESLSCTLAAGHQKLFSDTDLEKSLKRVTRRYHGKPKFINPHIQEARSRLKKQDDQRRDDEAAIEAGEREENDRKNRREHVFERLKSGSRVPLMIKMRQLRRTLEDEQQQLHGHVDNQYTQAVLQKEHTVLAAGADSGYPSRFIAKQSELLPNPIPTRRASKQNLRLCMGKVASSNGMLQKSESAPVLVAYPFAKEQAAEVSLVASTSHGQLAEVDTASGWSEVRMLEDGSTANLMPPRLSTENYVSTDAQSRPGSAPRPDWGTLPRDLPKVTDSVLPSPKTFAASTSVTRLGGPVKTRSDSNKQSSAADKILKSISVFDHLS